MRLPATLAALLLASALLPPVTARAEDTMTADTADTRITALLEWSRAEGRGLSIYVEGQEAIHGVVRELLVDGVVLRNQERGTIIIRRERISAVAGQ